MLAMREIAASPSGRDSTDVPALITMRFAFLRSARDFRTGRLVFMPEKRTPVDSLQSLKKKTFEGMRLRIYKQRVLASLPCTGIRGYLMPGAVSSACVCTSCPPAPTRQQIPYKGARRSTYVPDKAATGLLRRARGGMPPGASSASTAEGPQARQVR
jgi:hypothetical protein